MNFVVILDLLSLLFTLSALVILLVGCRSGLRREVKWILVALLVLCAYRDGSNLIEWSGLSIPLPTEDFVEILEPMAWVFVFYGLLRGVSESELRDAERRYRSLLDSANDAILVADTETGVIVQANRRAEDLLGLSVDRIIGMHESDFHPPEMREAYRNLFPSLLQGQTPEPSPGLLVLHQDGRRIPVDVSAALVEIGGRMLVMGIFRDITRRLEIQEALRERERYYRSLLYSLHEDILVIDRSYRIADVNSDRLRSTGIARDELIGRACFEASHGYDVPCTQEGIECPLREVFETGVSRTRQHLHRRSDGSEVRVDVSYSPLRDEAGYISHVIESVRDITDLFEAQQAALGLEARLQHITEQTPISVWSTNRDLRLSHVSGAITTHMRELMETENVLGRRLSDIAMHLLLDEDMIERLVRRAEKALSGQTERFEGFVEGKVMEMVMSPLRDSAGAIEGIVMVTLDVTERRRLEEQLNQARKMEAIGRLAGGVAHDFNNLLTAIQGYTDLAMMAAEEMEPLFRDLRQIRQATTRASRLTRQLLAFSRRQPMEIVSVELNELVDDMLKMLVRLLGEDIEIVTHLESELWGIQGDTGTLEQVLMNLALNARDAMPGGGRLTIHTENVWVDEGHLAVMSDARPGQFVRLSIIDTGHGMDSDTMQHIFEPFYTTKAQDEGTGLGLAVVYGIVRQHEGWINVYSEPEMGTSFSVYLPAASQAVSVSTDETPDVAILRGDGEHVLLLEDEDSVRAFVSRVLQEHGYVVTAASGQAEALQIFDRQGDTFDLVFSDVVLPDGNGVELVRDLISRRPDLRILFASGYSDDRAQWATIDRSSYQFLQKPYSLVELLSVVKQTLKPASSE